MWEMSKELKLSIAGSLAADAADEQRARLLGQVGEGVAYVEIDLSGVTDMDSRGADALFDIHKDLKLKHTRLNLVSVPELVRQVLVEQRLDDVLPIEQDRTAPVRPQPAPRPAYRGDAPPARKSKLGLLIGLVLALGAVVAIEYVYLNRPGIPAPNDADKARFALGNAKMIGSVLGEYRKKYKRFPGRPEDVQALLGQRGLSLVNLYTGEPLQVVAEGATEPGAMVYRVSRGHYYLQPLGPEGSPLPGPDGKPALVSDAPR